MKIKIPKKHIIFTIAYFFTMLTMLLNQIDALPMAMVLRKTKYAYIIFVMFLFFSGKRVKRQSVAAIISLSIFMIHTILFGFVFNTSLGAQIAAENINKNVDQLIWFLLVVFVTYIYVAQNGIFRLFISASFYVTGLQLLIGCLQHRGDIVNPLWGFRQAFGGGIRYKTTFGFVHAGYLSNAAYLVIVLSIFFFEIYRHYKDARRIIMWISLIVIDGLAVEMLAAAAERSGIISTAIVVGFYLFFVFFRIRVELFTKVAFAVLLAIGAVCLVASGVFDYIWSNSNRELNIVINYPIFQELGNLWTGMGYVDNSGFHGDIMAFGVKTSSLDMYYVYIFFTTGVIGCILIGFVLIFMLVELLVHNKSPLNTTAIGLYFSMLFFAVWQCNMATYRYVSPTILLVIILCAMSDDCCITKEDQGILIEIANKL